MVYIFESDLPKIKSINFALKNIYGLGKFNSELICKKAGFSTNLKIKDLSREQLNKLVKTIESLNFVLASDLKKSRLMQNKLLISIKVYKGFRKVQGLPSRGQRTHTNARTAKKKML